MFTVTNFQDECYTPELVNAVNEILDSNLTALQMWGAMLAELQEIEGEGGFDTSPCEFLLMIMDERQVRGFGRLAKRFGYEPQGPEVFAKRAEFMVRTGLEENGIEDELLLDLYTTLVQAMIAQDCPEETVITGLNGMTLGQVLNPFA